MNICFFGVGGVGGYYGTLLTRYLNETGKGNTFSKANQFPFETKTSFQRDVEAKGRQSEWDLFGGAVIRYAERFNIPADNTKATLDKLLQDL